MSAFVDTITDAQNEESHLIKKQSAKFGDYENPDCGCPECGRYRVMRGEDGKHRCEKCYWCIEDVSYDSDMFNGC